LRRERRRSLRAHGLERRRVGEARHARRGSRARARAAATLGPRRQAPLRRALPRSGLGASARRGRLRRRLSRTLDPRAAHALDRWGRAPLDPDQDGLFAKACRAWFRVEWEGLEHLPREGGALLVANHAGLMPVDGGVIQYGIESQA